MEQTQHTAHTPINIPRPLVETASDCGVVRVPSSIEGAHTHTEPEAQMEELLGEDDDVPAHGMHGLDIDQDKFEELLRSERTRRAVKRVLDAEERPKTEIPPAQSLTERFANVRPAVEYRIEHWFVDGGHVLLVAQYKTGKTTLVGNLVRSLVDGDPFLGAAKVRPVSGVVILDFEMSEAQIEGWLRDQNIRNTDRVHLVSLRGAASSFDILDPERRREWAKRLRSTGAQFVVLDCLRPAMDALGLDEHSEAGRFLTALDELLKEANIPEALIVHHSGHGNERSRGDSRILDWPDGIWNLNRGSREDLNSPRFISAKGRDIEVVEGELRFDQHTRRLTYVVRDRKAAAADQVMSAVLRTLADASEPMSIRGVQAALQGRHSKAAVHAALKRGANNILGYFSVIKSRGAELHGLTPAGRAMLDLFFRTSGMEAIQ
jgi:hypothetical protein